jgi:LPS O-antigen subunit length determinant protein (WzzB/FepE family)
MAKSKGVKGTILIIVLMALVIGYYFYLSNYQKKTDETVVTAVQDVLLRDLDTNYPPTPREVLKYYSDITKCLYNEKYTEEQLEQMADKLLALYDEELAENNPRDEYIKDLKNDVSDFTKNGYSIVSYTTSTSTDVEEYTYDGRQCARLYCTYSVKSGADYKTSKQVFVLRKETETGHWKILGFELVNPE